MAKVGIFLITVALIAGIAGYGGGGGGAAGVNEPESYTLTIDSTSGGSVTVNNMTVPGEGIFTYNTGTVISLNATPEIGHHSVKWTGDVGTVDNVHASQTSITMNGDYSIMANFEVPTPIQYGLSILSPHGGLVATPGEGIFTRDSGTVVDPMATPARGYESVQWTGNVSTIANVNAASTTITMSGNYYICAHFLEVRSCYGLGK